MLSFARRAGIAIMSDEAIVVIPLPTQDSTVTYAAARLVHEEGRAFAEAIVPVPGTTFAPPKRMSLSPRSLARLEPGAPRRAALYLYGGMILPAPT